MGVPHPSSGFLSEGLDTANRLTRLQQKLQWPDPLSPWQLLLLGMLVPIDRLSDQR